MAYVKAAIFTTLILIIALLGFVFLSFGADYQVNVAFESFQKGDFNKAITLLDKVEQDEPEARIYLYKAYVFRAQDRLPESDAQLENALHALKAHEKREVKFEILLNLALNGYLQDNPQKMTNPIQDATKIFSDNTYLHFLTGLEHFALGEYERALFQWNRAPNRMAISEWMKKTFDAYFNPTWTTLRSARCYIELNQPLQARQMLEVERTDASPDDQAAIAFLMGLSYTKEAEDKVVAAVTPYYKLAMSYFNRVPLQDPRFTKEKETIIHLLSEAANSFIANELYDDLALITTTFDAWRLEEQLDHITSTLITKMEEAIAQNRWEQAFELASVLNRLLPAGATRDDLGIATDKAVREAFRSSNVENLPEMWEIAKQLSKDSQGLTRDLLQGTMQRIVRDVANEEVNLDTIAPYVTFWQKLENDPAKRLAFALRLVEMSEQFWIRENEERALEVMILAERLPLANQQPKLRSAVEKVLTRVYDSSFAEEGVTKLPYLLKAVDRFRISSLNLKNPETLANYLAQAQHLLEDHDLDAAENRAAWVLTVDPSNMGAKQLIALINYRSGNYEKATLHFQQMGRVPANLTEAYAISETLASPDINNEKPLLRLNTITRDGKLRLALGYLLKDHPLKTLEWIDRIEIQDVITHTITAVALFEHEDFNAAITALKEVTPPYSELPAVQGINILSLAALNRHDEAQGKLNRLLTYTETSKNKDVAPLIQQLIHHKFDGWTRYYIAGVYYKEYRNDPELALTFFEKIEPPTAHALLELGDLYLDRQRTDKAIELLSKALEKRQTPRFIGKAGPLLAQVAETEGRYDQALELYRKLLQQKSSEADWHVNAAKCLFHLKRWDLARGFLEHAQKQRKLNPDETLLLTETWVRTRDTEMAINLARNWIKNEEITLIQKLKLAKLMLMARTPGLVASLLSEVPHNYDELNTQERIAFVDTLLFTGDIEKVEEIKDPFNADLQSSPEGRLILAKIKQATEQTEEGLTKARLALEQAPNNREVRAFLDDHETNLENIRERVQSLKQTVDNQPNQSVSTLLTYTDQLIHLVVEENRQNDADETDSYDRLHRVIRLLENLSLMDTSYPEVYFQLGKCYHLLNQPQKALERYQQALVLAPSYGKAYKFLARALEKQARYKAAALSLKSAIRWDPDDSEAWLQLARLDVALNNMYEAKKALGTVVRYQPHNDEALLRLGQVLLELKNPEDAKPVLEKAVNIKPNNVQALTLLLLCLYDPTLQMNVPDKRALALQQEETLRRIQKLDPKLGEDLQRQIDRSDGQNILRLTQPE